MYVRFDKTFDAKAYNNLIKKIAKKRATEVAAHKSKGSPSSSYSTLPASRDTSIAGNGAETLVNNHQRLPREVLSVQGKDENPDTKDSRSRAPVSQGQPLKLPSIKIPVEGATYLPQESASLPPVGPLIRPAAHLTGKDNVDPIGSTPILSEEISHDNAASSPAMPLTKKPGDIDAASCMDRNTRDTLDLQSPHGSQIQWQTPIEAHGTNHSSARISVNMAASRRSSALSVCIEGATGGDNFPRETDLEIFDSSSEEERQVCIEVAPAPADRGTAGYTRAVRSVDDETHSDEREVHRIIGEEQIDGQLHYMVEWKPSLVSENDAHNIGQLIKEWKQRKMLIRARARKSKKRKLLPIVDG
ncbi:hypothetical protein RJ55_07253 [Drechmeria coniospora]|nr:hypothetical protein RJ55_07253 [Drechmeria coniospora]